VAWACATWGTSTRSAIERAVTSFIRHLLGVLRAAYSPCTVRRLYARGGTAPLLRPGAAGPGAERHVAAVDADVLAGHEARFVAGQEQHHVGDILTGANAPDGVALPVTGERGFDAVRLPAGRCAHHLCVDRAGADRQHADVLGGVLYGQLARERQHAAFTRRVRRHPLHRLQA